MINEADLRQLTPAERRRLARMIAEMDYPHPLLDLKVDRIDRRRKIGALASAAACVVLIAWIIVLIMTLRREYTATHWRDAWVGFDFVLLAAFAVTGWAFWRGRQIVIACLLTTATLLCCDAWFDVILDLRTDDMWLSIASAAFVELPLAFVLLNAARRLIRMSALAAVGAGGVRLPLPSLWRLPLASFHMPGQGNEPGRDCWEEKAGTADSHHHPLGKKITAPGAGPHPAGRRTLRAWPPTSPRRPRPTPSSRASRRPPTPGCERSLPAWSGTCTGSPGTWS